MKIILLAVAAGLALAGCQTATDAPTLSDAEAFAQARKAVLATMKDPDSAKIDPQLDRRKSSSLLGSTDIVCGHVNGKNSFGAFTGAKRFAYRIADRQVIIDGQDSDPLYRNAASLWCA